MTAALLTPQLAYLSTLPGALDAFKAAAARNKIPVEILLALASRESGMGTSRLLKNWRGDNGNAEGLMQIDQRWHPKFANETRDDDHEKNVEYGARFLRSLATRYKDDWKKALAAYNSGPGNVDKAIKAKLDPDFYTTGKNYGADVLARAKTIRSLIDFGKAINPLYALVFFCQLVASSGI